MYYENLPKIEVRMFHKVWTYKYVLKCEKDEFYEVYVVWNKYFNLMNV